MNNSNVDGDRETFARPALKYMASETFGYLGKDTLLRKPARVSPSEDLSDLHAPLDRERPAVVSSGAKPSATAVSEAGDSTLFEGRLPVYARLSQREEGVHEFEICVRTGRAGAHGVSRAILVRLTDPEDPYLLFQLELLEDDYGAFKQKLELLVDFNGFPRYLVSMLESIGSEDSALRLSFAVQANDSGSGTLRAVQANAYKTVEHISLVLTREGDIGQKKYLAERFHHFQEAYLLCADQRHAERREARGTIESLQSLNESLKEENAQLQERIKYSDAENERSRLASIQETKDKQEQALRDKQRDYDRQLHDSRQKASDLQQQYLNDIRSKDASLSQLRDRVAALESEQASLQSQLRAATERLKAEEDELTALREKNASLSSFHLEASRAMSENELAYVTVTERLGSALTSLKIREHELSSLQEQYQKQDDYIRILSGQNEKLSEQKQSLEQNLAKTHHIITTQVQNIKHNKERLKVAVEQLHSTRALLSEKETAQARVKDELSSATERASTLQRKNGELREQLQQTDDARKSLTEELANSQKALLHLQRSTSVNGRHWGVFSHPGMTGSSAGSYGSTLGTAGTRPMAAGSSTSVVPGTESYNADMYREFNRHVSLGENAGGLQGSLSRAASAGWQDARSPSSPRAEAPNERSRHVNGGSYPAHKDSCDATSTEGLSSASKQSRTPSAEQNNAITLSAKSFFPLPRNGVAAAPVKSGASAEMQASGSAYF